MGFLNSLRVAVLLATLNTFTLAQYPAGNAGNSYSSSGSGSSTGSPSTFGAPSAAEIASLERAASFRQMHGIIMATVLLILFPIGAILMPLLGKWWLHATWQIVSILILISGFGIGLWVANDMDHLFNNTHTILGIVLVVLFLTALPMLGAVQHVYYRKYKRRGIAGYVHQWTGRVLIVLGVVNGGLGIKLAKQNHDTGNKKKGYTIVAAVMGSLYVVIVVGMALVKRRRGGEEVKKEESKSSSVNSGRARVWI